MRSISLTYYPKLTNKLNKFFKKHKIQKINSNKFKIKNHLETTKNKKDTKSKSGIYKITGGTRRCGFKYIGQSRRAIQTRFREHHRAFKNNHSHQCAVAEHILMKDRKKRGYKHKFDIHNLELIRQVNKHRKLEFYESYQIHREDADHLMNLDQGSLKSTLFDVILKNNAT
jgi:endonuclease I